MGVGMGHLQALYADSHDPWGFESSAYEHRKFEATRASLSRANYDAAFELGCGNGQLAQHLVHLCARYIGVDAVEKAVIAAREAVPSGIFRTGFYPFELPSEKFDLLIFSEILYFLDQNSIGKLASDVSATWPEAEVICVSYLGPSGNELQGEEAVTAFMMGLTRTHVFELVEKTEGFRIDRGLPRGRS